MASTESLFGAFLDRHNDQAWGEALDRLQSAIHPVDARAVRIWFAFFPLALHRAISDSPDPSKSILELRLSGRFRLAEQVDSSHQFLYGHRYWRDVKREVNEYAAGSPQSLNLNEQILEAAKHCASRLGVDASLLVGMTAVAFMTLQQVGHERFREDAEVRDYGASWKMSPEQVLANRARDDGQGVLGFLRTIDKQFSVNFSEYDPKATFKVINDQDLTTAAARDTRDHAARDSRCIEGPIPVECRTAACGTCWVGILSDSTKLAPPTPREITKMRDFGYAGFNGQVDSLIRLACQSRAHGNVSLVIPPWNGLIGKVMAGEGA
ncbi:MAG: 2Fe-2S iron-sulfur cluster-binding protein [Acidobacteriota bacterium]